MNWSKRTKILAGLVALLFLGSYVVYKIIYKPHQIVAEAEAAFIGSANDFKSKVANDQVKWQNAIVQLQGNISNTDDSGIIMDETIYCQFINLESLKSLSVGEDVIVKGRFIGYDDLLEEIKLDNCGIFKK